MLLDRYVGQAVLRVFLLTEAGLTALLSLLIFIEQLALVGKGHYGTVDALGYTLLTIPDRVLQLAPVCMILAALLGLGGLARGSELIGFQSFGVSEARIIGSVVKLCVPVAVTLFLLAQFVIPPTQLAAQRLQASALGSALPGLEGGGFWARKDRVFLNVRSFAGGVDLQGVSVYDLNPDGSLRFYIEADQARIAPDGSWGLRGIVREQVREGRVETDHPASLRWMPFLSNTELRMLAIPPQTMPPLALFAYVQELKRAHQPVELYEQAFWSMVAIPISLVAMALIAGPFVFGPQRSGGAGRQILIGALLGIVFLLVQQISLYLGLLLELNAAISALAPSLALLCLGLWALEREEPLVLPL